MTQQNPGTASSGAETAPTGEAKPEPAPRSLRNPDEPATVRDLFDAGVHFGHQTKRWNPKMRPYLFGQKNGVHIIDLDQTVQLMRQAFHFVMETTARGGHILFVGTKRQAQEIVREEAQRAGMYFVINRWLGGTLTNFRTIKGGLERLRSLERMKEDGTYQQLPKKEIASLEKERTRLEKYLGGLKGMGSLPHAIFVVDPPQEQIAIAEASKLGIPIVAITDSNCDPEHIAYPIPGNDDALRAIRLLTESIADACLLGTARRKDALAGRDREQGGGGEGTGDRREETVVYQRRASTL